MVITHPTEFMPLNLAADLLRDKTCNISLAQVTAGHPGFFPITDEMYSFRQDDAVSCYWFRCRINNATAESLREFLCFQSGLDSLQLFLLSPDGRWQRTADRSFQLTRRRPFFVSQQLALPIDLPPGTSTLYVRIYNHSASSQQLNSLIVSLADQRAFVNYFLEWRLYQGVVLGILFLMLLLHLFIYWFVKEKAYLIFLINLAFTILYLLLRKNFQFEFDFLLPVLPGLTALHDFFGVMVSVTAIWFAQDFLDTKRQDPVMHRVLRLTMAVQLLVAVAIVGFVQVLLMKELTIYLGFLSGMLVIATAFRSFRSGNRLAIYVLLGFLLLAFVPIVYVVPLPNYLDFRVEESNVVYLGEAIRSVIFAIGIADRFYLMKDEISRHAIEKRETLREQEEKLRREKDRISSDLHDNIGSELATLSVELELLAKQSSQRETFREVQQSILGVTGELRDTVWALEKDQLTAADLEHRVATVLGRHRASAPSVRFTLAETTGGSFVLTPAQGIAVIRICQEALHNARKHSACTEVTICFSGSPGQAFSMTISDNGKGFEPARFCNDEEGHYGLKNMQRRAVEIGGRFDLQSAPGAGTTLRVTFRTA